MKMILFASALALSTAAFAQDTTPAQPMQPAGAAMPDASTPPSAPMTPDASAPAAALATPDASGPAASSAMPATGASSVDDSNLPMCSKTVTDKCKSGGKSSGHKTMHHKKK